MAFSILVPSVQSLQGVKAVYGMVEGSYLGFSRRGDAEAALAKAKEGAKFVIAVGASGSARACRGRLLNVVKVKGPIVSVRTETMPWHHKFALRKYWPFLLTLNGVWLIDDCPLAKNVPGITQSPLMGAYGRVVSDASTNGHLYKFLSGLQAMPVPVPFAGER